MTENQARTESSFLFYVHKTWQNFNKQEGISNLVTVPKYSTQKIPIFRFCPLLFQLLQARHTQDKNITAGVQSHPRAAAEAKLPREENVLIAELGHVMDQDQSYHEIWRTKERTQDWDFESLHQVFDFYTCLLHSTISYLRAGIVSCSFLYSCYLVYYKNPINIY